MIIQVLLMKIHNYNKIDHGNQVQLPTVMTICLMNKNKKKVIMPQQEMVRTTEYPGIMKYLMNYRR